MEKPKSRYIKTDDNTVYDSLTSLMWMANDSRLDKDKEMSWDEANEYAKEMNEQKFAGHSDWRLPTIGELEKLYDPGAEGRYKIRAPYELTAQWVWSTTKGRSDQAWLFDFFSRSGRVRVRIFGRRAVDRRALCVRRSGE